MNRPLLHRLSFPTVLALVFTLSCKGSAADLDTQIRPLMKEYCLGCHSTEKHKGDLDLERFTSRTEALKQPKVWQGVIEQIGLGEMPPKDKPQPSSAQKEQIVNWAGALLDEIALSRAGDPGPVLLRRLSNSEFTYTLRDLTSVASLDPAKEFPTDSASGEGFMNVGNSLVMSPSLLTKYLDAAKNVASHAVLLPDGLRFSPSTYQRDWTEEAFAAIRAFYDRFTVNGGGSAVNLQGIRFDTKDGGVIPLENYFAATIASRDSLLARRQTPTEAARAAGLNSKYFTTLWNALTNTTPSLLLDPLRGQWRSTVTPSDTGRLLATVAHWQQSLWRFTTIGHIGKRDGPKSWQVPVVPIAEAREVRLKNLTAENGKDVTIYLTTSDAGDGSENDFAVWENPRLVARGRPDLALRDVRAALAALSSHREKLFTNAAACLAAASTVTGPIDRNGISSLAQKHGLDLGVLSAWLNCLGIGDGDVRIAGHMTNKSESLQSYDFIKGWVGADALSILANSSDQHVRVPGNMKPHGIAVHPSPKLRVLVSWRSPVTSTLRAEGSVQHAHTECGNGIEWFVELRRGNTRQGLASGISQGAKEIKWGPVENLNVQPGDVICLAISPRDGNHSCDLTAIDLQVGDSSHVWNLAKDVSPNILAGNPHADSQGNAGVWHFHSEPDAGGKSEPIFPVGSLLANWRSHTNADQRRLLANAMQQLLLSEASPQTNPAPDLVLYRQLTSLTGPLLSGVLSQIGHGSASNAFPPNTTPYGIDPKLFGKHPNGTTKLSDTSLCIQAPSVIAISLPAELVAGCDFVATASLHKETATEGSVQMQALTTKPPSLELAAGSVKEQGGKSTWSDGELPVVSDSPILTTSGSRKRTRIEADLDTFRQLFPAALCYTKIVPVDEVVTLTLYYREDDALRRLMLNDSETAELERLWGELHYVSHDAIKLVDAFDQLWQFATQDADPSAFEPLREPIKKRAEDFKKWLNETQPRHLDGVIQFASKAYRRPLRETERAELLSLYRKLRDEDMPHDQAIRLTLARIFVAPAFLYRAENAAPGDHPGPVTDSELATRLSYFLWSSTPDAELLTLAKGGRLHEPDVLVAQARRMLKDPRARRLATEFACAWLHVYAFDELSEKSERHFPTFTKLRGAMYEETIRFCTDVFQRDRSILDILNADDTFLNEDLAQHYGIPGVKGSEWRRVDGLRKLGRGGILGQATTLAKQSGASRTSPILRGNWVAEVLLGEKLPRPPKDVPRLPEDEATETLTMRQLTEKHSTDPKCYGCHRRIDPYGYSLEAFDPIGRLRDHDLGGRAIDTHARPMDGTEFEGINGLRNYLLTQRLDGFVKQFSRKILGYSLGRSVMVSDGPLINDMRAQLKSQGFRVGAAVEAIVRSQQFRQIRGKDMIVDD